MKYESLYKAFYTSDDRGKKLYSDRFNNDSTFHLYDYIGDYSAFVCCNFEMMALIEEIYQLNNEIVELVKQPHLFEAFNQWMTFDTLIEEIIMTNEIEGVVSTRKEIGDLLDVRKPKEYHRFYGIVNKYREIINNKEFVSIDQAKDVRYLYDQMMLFDIKNTKSKNVPNGEIFRKDPVEIYSGSKIIHKGVMPESAIIKAMDQALEFLNNKDLPLLLRVAAFHYLFGYIHPFYDGNGRMDRYISSYYLSSGLNQYVALQLSEACKKSQKKYYNAFKITNDPRNRGDLTYFVLTFFEIMIDGMKSLRDKIEDRQEKYQHYYAAIASLNLPNQESEIIGAVLQNSLFNAPSCTITDLASQVHKSSKTIAKHLSVFVKRGYILKRKMNRSFSYKFNYDYFDFNKRISQ